MIVNLKRRVPMWCQEGLISPAAGESIIAFEATRGVRNWIGFGIAGIGVTAVATGVISLVAANWEMFSDSAKLIGYFLLQAALGALFLRIEKEEGVWREAVLTLFALLFLAGIGLVGQVYHLSGNWWSPIALWCGLALPASLCARSRLLPSLWSLAVVTVPLLWIHEQSSSATLLHTLLTLLSATMLLTAGSFFGQTSGKLREEFCSALLIFGLGFLLVVATPWVNVVWSQRYSFLAEAKPFYLMGAAWLATIIAMAASLLRFNEARNLRLTTALLLVVLASYVSIPYVVNTREIFPGAFNSVAAAVGFLLVWLLAAASAAMASRTRLFDLATSVIAIRFIVIYFEVFGSLTTTGIGLIISGLVIIGVGVAWNRSRKRIKSFVGVHR